MPSTSSNPDPDAPGADWSRGRRFWPSFVLCTTLALGSCAGCVALMLPTGQLAEDARAGAVGDAVDEALRRGDAGPLVAHVGRVPGARVCFVREYMVLRHEPFMAYGWTYGLPNLQVPDSHWVIAVLHAAQPPEFAVVRTQRLILSEKDQSCTDAERLRLELENRPGQPSLLRVSAEP